MSQELPQIDSGDLQRLGEVSEQINSAAEKHHVDPNVLAGIASRESNVGAALKDGYGDDGKAYGVNQVDLNAHPGADQVGGPTSQEHFDQSAQILQHNTEQVTKDHPEWTSDQQQQGGVAAYNFGTKNVQTVENMDKGTAHNNYSADVTNRAEQIKDAGVLEN